jgi:zinc protease
MKHIKKIKVLAAFMLMSFTLIAQKLDRSKLPAPGPAPIIKLAKPVITKLANGLTILVVEDHKLPKIYCSLNIDLGSITEGSKVGTTDLLNALMREGTTKQSRDAFNEKVDAIGASLNVGYSGGNVAALTKYFNQAFALFAEGMLSPALSSTNLEDVRKKQLTGIKAAEKNAKAIHNRMYNVITWGVNHPNSEYATEETTNNIKTDDVKAAYQKYVTPNRAYLIFVGDISPTTAKLLAQRYFLNWKSSGYELEKIPNVANSANNEIYVCDVPTAKQTLITALRVNDLPKSAPDVYAGYLANDILGGGGEGRLFLNLREKRGFTYGSYSNLESSRNQSAFSASAEVRHEVVDSATEALLYEVQHISNVAVDNQTLIESKNKYNGNFALSLESNATIIQNALSVLTNNLPSNYYANYLKNINAVTVADVLNAAKKYISGNNLKICITGKADAFKDKLTRLGYRVNYVDKFGRPLIQEAIVPIEKPKDAGAIATEDLKDVKKILEKAIVAIGGMDAINKVKTIVQEGSTSIQGRTISVTVKKMMPNMEVSSTELEGMGVMQKEVFDGTKGSKSGRGVNTELKGDDLQAKLTNKSIFKEVNLMSKNVTLEGTDKVGDKQAYKLKLVEGARVWYYYFDKISGLLIGMKSSEKSPVGEVEVLTLLSNYKAVNGVQFPHLLSKELGPQSIDMEITSIKINEGVTAEDFK